MSDLFCGIDFGTSNSTVSLADQDKSWLIPLEGGEVTLPSAVFWEAGGAPPQFGRAAIAAYVSGEDGRLMRGLKSTLGSSLIDERTAVGTRSVSFVDVLSRFFGEMRRKLDLAAEGMTKVVLGRPVHFVDDDDAADAKAQAVLEKIARAHGFNEVLFQYEPIAAALQYEQSVPTEELVLIVDIGGGTSDFSIVRVSPDRARAADRAADILANDGIRVGGTDFDRLLSLAEVMPHLGFKTALREDPSRELPASVYFDLATWHRIALLNGNSAATFLKEMHYSADQPALVHRLMRVVREQTGHQLAGDVEAAKIALSDSDRALIELPYVDATLRIALHRKSFEQATAGETQKIANSIGECLAQAGVKAKAITTIFITGGTSAIPSVRQACLQQVPLAALVEGSRFGSVGLGLTIHSGIIAKAS